LQNVWISAPNGYLLAESSRQSAESHGITPALGNPLAHIRRVTMYQCGYEYAAGITTQAD
jgi:hypothetical protein